MTSWLMKTVPTCPIMGDNESTDKVAVVTFPVALELWGASVAVVMLSILASELCEVSILVVMYSSGGGDASSRSA